MPFENPLSFTARCVPQSHRSIGRARGNPPAVRARGQRIDIVVVSSERLEQCMPIGIPHATIETPETTAETIQRASETAFTTGLPAACLLPRRLTTPNAASGLAS